MSTVNLQPQALTSSKKLPSSGNTDNVLAYLGQSAVYTSSIFITASAAAVSLAYNFFVGNVLDIELEERNIYQAYQQALLKYSYLVNTHQAKNVLYDLMGFSTATFNVSGSVSTGTDISLKSPNFSLGYARRMAMSFGAEIAVGGNIPTYSASFDTIIGQQDYDLQSLIGTSTEFSGIVNNKRMLIKEVFYKTSLSNWRFFGMFGGFGALGYGNGGPFSNHSNVSQFQVTPVWETKLQMMNFEDALWTRTSHFSFEIINNKLRLFPIPGTYSPSKFWIKFQVENDAWDDQSTGSAVNGINNMNSLPFGNIPLEHINGPGQLWIKEYFLALVAKMLGLVRGKFGPIQFVKGNYTLNSADLLSVGKDDLKNLEDSLTKLLDDMVAHELAVRKKTQVENTLAMYSNVPLSIYIK